MKYNSRLTDAAKYSTVLDKEKMLLSKLYYINPDDLINNLIQDKKMGNYYRDLLMQGNQASSLHETIAGKRLEIIQYQQDHYLLDRQNNQLFNIRRLIGDYTLDLSRVSIRNLDTSGAINTEQSSNTSKALGQLTQVFDLTIAEPDRGNDQKRKKRKQRKF
jgi:hypothetical protein